MTENIEPNDGDLALLITEHELAALSTLTNDQQGPTSAKLLGLEGVRANDALIRAGLTTLLARGLGQLDENGLFTAQGKGLVLAGILNSATDWLRLHYGDGDGEGMTAIICSPIASLFLEFHASGLFNATPIDSSVDVLNLAGAFLGANDDTDAVIAAPFHCEIVRLSLEGEKTHELDVDSPDQWTLADGTVGEPAALWPGVLARLGYTR